MPYPYRCPWCGQTHNEDDLLIDLYPFCGYEGDFSLLKLRLTTKDLESLIEAQPEIPGRDGYKEWSPSFTELMAIAAAPHNSNNPLMQHITLEEIDAFIEWYSQIYTPRPPKSAFDLFTMDDESEEDEEEEPTVSEFEYSPAMSSILNSETEYDNAFTLQRMVWDFGWIQAMYRVGNPVFYLRPTYKNCTLIGLHVIYNQCHQWINTRRCFSCGTEVPEYACAVPQKMVSLFGKILTSKTTTLLALVHYAINGSASALPHPIWSEAERLSSIRNFSLINPQDSLSRDLENYEQGISPPKYGTFRRDLPVADLLVTDMKDCQTILTLINPPGELCYGENGKINANLLYNEFPAVLKSDALIHCVSTRYFEREKIISDYSSAESLVSFLAMEGNFCPILTLFTDLPASHPVTNCAPLSSEIDMLKSEHDALCQNKETADYLDASKNFTHMCINSKTIYRNVMHCNPLGCNIPLVYSMDSTMGERPVPPSPENIPLLMKWILGTTGILPVTKTKFTKGELNDNQITRPQYRFENPVSRKEAIARCTLFANPGRNDQALAHASSKLQQKIVEFQMNSRPNI